MKKNVPLDVYDDMPAPMKRYISNFGWHFNKAACYAAVSMMWKENEDGKKVKIQPFSKSHVDEVLKKNGVEIENKLLYDYVYAFHMSMADYVGKSIDDEKHLAKHVKAIVDDVDKPGGNVFRHWYWDMVDAGMGVEFADFLDSEDDEEEP